jgi:hypothetical protein
VAILITLFILESLQLLTVALAILRNFFVLPNICTKSLSLNPAELFERKLLLNWRKLLVQPEGADLSLTMVDISLLRLSNSLFKVFGGSAFAFTKLRQQIIMKQIFFRIAFVALIVRYLQAACRFHSNAFTALPALNMFP